MCSWKKWSLDGMFCCRTCTGARTVYKIPLGIFCISDVEHSLFFTDCSSECFHVFSFWCPLVGVRIRHSLPLPLPLWELEASTALHMMVQLVHHSTFTLQLELTTLQTRWISPRRRQIFLEPISSSTVALIFPPTWTLNPDGPDSWTDIHRLAATVKTADTTRRRHLDIEYRRTEIMSFLCTPKRTKSIRWPCLYCITRKQTILDHYQWSYEQGYRRDIARPRTKWEN